MGQAPAVPEAGGLYKKLAAVMAEVGRVPKSGRNQFHKYDYVTEADLVDAVRDKLASRNVAMIPSVVDVGERTITTDRGKESTVTTVRMAFTFCDGDTGETFRAEWAGSGDDAGDKGIYKAYTGGLKYFLMKTFLIATGDDPENDSRQTSRPQRRAQAPAAPRPAHQGPGLLDTIRAAIRAKDSSVLKDAEWATLVSASNTKEEKQVLWATLAERYNELGGDSDALKTNFLAQVSA